MKKFFIGLGMVSSIAIASSYGEAKWSYNGDTGPEKWGDISTKYEMCKKGLNQSPINIVDMVEAKLPALELKDNGESKEFINNGHTVKLSFKEGSTLKIDGKEFNLLQYHFHTPSENKIDGKFYDMEGHFVHASKDGELAVIALMFNKGNSNPALDKMVAAMPYKVGEKKEIKGVTPYSLLPKNLDYYRFNGSLTTPPCTEGVRWFVIKETASMSKEQWNAFNKAMGKNNRPVQPLNARKVMK